MATTKNIAEGFGILVRYFDDPNAYHVCAEHDIIYVSNPDNPIAEDHIKLLSHIGWTYDEDEEHWYVFG